MGGLEDDLRRREDVDDEAIGEIIGLAMELQQEALRRQGQLRADEVASIAEELDIDGEYVEEAIALRREEVRGAKLRAQEVSDRRRERRRFVGIVGTLTLGFVALVLLVLGVQGARALAAAEAEVIDCRAALERVIERSFVSAPQQLALVHADTGAFKRARDQYDTAPDVHAKLRAARLLNDSLADALAAAPPQGGADAAQLRLNVHFELSGLANRVATELSRYEAAKARLEVVESEFGPALARRFRGGRPLE